MRLVTEQLTAVVTVADDGGSSGRLRGELGVLPPGDLRMALAALGRRRMRPDIWAEALFQHRFGGTGALAGHAVGNLLLAGLSRCSAIRWPRWTGMVGLLGVPRPGAADERGAARHRGE